MFKCSNIGEMEKWLRQIFDYMQIALSDINTLYIDFTDCHCVVYGMVVYIDNLLDSTATWYVLLLIYVSYSDIASKFIIYVNKDDAINIMDLLR